MVTGVFSSLTAAAHTGALSILRREQRASIIAAFKTHADAPAPLSPDNIRELMTFENSLYPVIQADKRWFFANTGKTEAVQFARDLNVLHSVAAKTLEGLVARRGEWSHGEQDPLLQQVIAFALYHHGAAIKWCFFRHEPVKPTLWPDLHGLYRFADQHGFAITPMALFNEEAQYQTTILALYLRALLLEVLNTGSLTMQQIEIADGWLAEWTPDYALDQNYMPRAHALFVDLDAMAGMQLVTGSKAPPGYRYVRVEGLKEQMEAVRTELRAGNPYHGRGAPNHFPMEEHVALLSAIERLYATLLQASASRIEERMPVSGLVAEVHLGFNAARQVIVNAAAGSIDGPAAEAPAGLSLVNDDAAAVSAAASAQPDLESKRWKVHDMSSKGMGLMIDRASGERVGVGQLLAIKPDGFRNFMLGVIVRKLTQRTVGETLLGVEILSYRPLPVVLARYNHPRDEEPDASSPPVEAMYLPGRDQYGKADILVLPAGDFGLKNVFSLPTKLLQFRVRINRVLRKGPDWTGLRFEVIGKK